MAWVAGMAWVGVAVIVGVVLAGPNAPGGSCGAGTLVTLAGAGM